MSASYENKPKTVKINNRRLILGHMIQSDIVTIADIRQHINLSKTTLTKIMSYLLNEGLILEMGKSDSTDEGGRKAITYQFNAKLSYTIAFHIFHNELYGVLTDLKCNILHTFSQPITSDITFDELMGSMIKGIKYLVAQEDITFKDLAGMAVGSHGLTDFQTGTAYFSPHFRNWPVDISLEKTLKAVFPYVPHIFVDNQIRFQSLAEQQFGSAKNNKNIIVIEAGVGLVAGIIVKEEIKRGTHSFAGEIGHMPLNPDSQVLCSCGGRGCFEALVSEKRLLQLVEDLKAKHKHSTLLETRENLDIPTVLREAESGDSLARELIEEVSKWWAIGIVNTVLMYDPNTIVIQGVYAQGTDYFLECVKEKIAYYSPILKNIDVSIKLSTLGKDRGTLGGAYYVSDHYIQSLTMD